MIDWTNLFYNALWILALAAALATVSWASWQASVQGTKLRTELTAPGSQRALLGAGALFSLGLALTSQTSPERIIWFAFAAVFAAQLILSLRSTPDSP